MDEWFKFGVNVIVGFAVDGTVLTGGGETSWVLVPGIVTATGAGGGGA